MRPSGTFGGVIDRSAAALDSVLGNLPQQVAACARTGGSTAPAHAAITAWILANPAGTYEVVKAVVAARAAQILRDGDRRGSTS